MEAIGGSTYKVLLTLAEGVVSEDPDFYASLQMNLPKMTAIEGLFQQNSKKWADIVKNKDKQEFIGGMKTLRNKLEKSDPDFRKAYENMYRLFEK